MTFFDTLKDKNMKAIFSVLAHNRYGGGGKSLATIMQQMTFEERFKLFVLTGQIMKAVGMPNWQTPQYLNNDPLDNTADA